jgi:hypothetical protein
MKQVIMKFYLVAWAKFLKITEKFYAMGYNDV